MKKHEISERIHGNYLDIYIENRYFDQFEFEDNPIKPYITHKMVGFHDDIS